MVEGVLSTELKQLMVQPEPQQGRWGVEGVGMKTYGTRKARKPLEHESHEGRENREGGAKNVKGFVPFRVSFADFALQ